ncbi:hypothetical protein [Flagellimonas aequoris]|uniref:Transposase n=1 Tax=Flagellimonas aequoris TaxID=2306997 RepID=A0A418N9L9_9FLAO|nr:hypothetical protein [Allomuricauda aequoris]RIV72192.1 hypothetical protein D2U88_06995 [Allomuricauda aequoris]TXK03963.1 hypothetical protein FQ019_06940 [Allomuricauda aequoris]
MANKQIDMRKIKRIFKLHTSGVSKWRISQQLGISRNTVAKYIDFFKRYGYTTLAGHMPSHHRFVSEWSSERFIAWAGNIGDSCQGYIMAILDQKQHPEQSYKSCLGVLHLAKKYGRDRLDSACRRATEYGAYNYNMVERILKKGWDKLDEGADDNLEMPEHQNIRGGKYYE